MKMLVTVASKHGATEEIGRIVAGVLRDAQLDVEVRAPETVESIDDYDAGVLGGGVYVGRWPAEARQFAERHADALAARPVWLFSSGPLGDPPKPEEEAPEAVALAERIGARDHRTFAGRLDRGGLGFLERTVVKVVGAPDGDYRDPATIRGWAAGIAADLVPRAVPA